MADLEAELARFENELAQVDSGSEQRNSVNVGPPLHHQHGPPPRPNAPPPAGPPLRPPHLPPPIKGPPFGLAHSHGEPSRPRLPPPPLGPPPTGPPPGPSGPPPVRPGHFNPIPPVMPPVRPMGPPPPHPPPNLLPPNVPYGMPGGMVYPYQDSVPVGYSAPMPQVTLPVQTIEDAAKKKEEEKKKKPVARTAAGKKWFDTSLSEWPENDFRIFVGDLGNEVNDDIITKAFVKYPSFQKAKVIRDKRTNKTKGYGFVSFLDGNDFAKALKEMQGKYIGNRPCKLRKSSWKDRQDPDPKRKFKPKKQKGNGNKRQRSVLHK